MVERVHIPTITISQQRHNNSIPPPSFFCINFQRGNAYNSRNPFLARLLLFPGSILSSNPARITLYSTRLSTFHLTLSPSRLNLDRTVFSTPHSSPLASVVAIIYMHRDVSSRPLYKLHRIQALFKRFRRSWRRSLDERNVTT